MKSRVFDYLAEAARSPSEQLSRGQQFVRQSYDLALYCWRQLRRHRAEGMAAELTYRTVFSLIPVVVLGLVMFRIFGGLEDVQTKVEYQLYSYFGIPVIPDAYQIGPTLVDEGGEGDRAGDSTDEEESADGAASERDTESAAEDNAAQASSDAGPPDINDADTSAGGAGPGQNAADGATSDRGGEVDGEASAAIKDELRQQTQREARASIRQKLHELTTIVTSIDFKSIGVFGLLLFVYAAVALADATEHLFNRIYDAPRQRPIHLRIAIHWSIITLGSGLLAMSLYMSGQVIEWSGTVVEGALIPRILGHVLSITFSWVLLFLLYALMPNTHVSVRAAIIGGLVGSLLWEAAKFGFQVYVTKAVPYSNIYGSIGLIPLFLFWIYVTWLIVLFGLILTYTLQTFGGRAPKQWRNREGATIGGDPDWMLPIMCEVGRAFEAGKSINQQEIADEIGLSSRVVHEMSEQLIQAGMLRRIAGEDDCLVLSKPADRIEIVDVLNLAHHVRPTNDHPAWQALADLKQAERNAAAGKTLADIVSEEIEVDDKEATIPVAGS